MSVTNGDVITRTVHPDQAAASIRMRNPARVLRRPAPAFTVTGDSISVQERDARCPVATLSRSAAQPGLGTRSRGRAPADVSNRLLSVPLCSMRRDVVIHASDCTAATHAVRQLRREDVGAEHRQCSQGEMRAGNRGSGRVRRRLDRPHLEPPRCRSRRPARQSPSASRPGARCGLSIPVTSVHEASTANQQCAAVG
jgi:hypothetical protein